MFSSLAVIVATPRRLVHDKSAKHIRCWFSRHSGYNGDWLL